MEDVKVEGQEVEIKVEVVKPDDVKTEEVKAEPVKEEVKVEEEIKDAAKEDVKTDAETKYDAMVEKLRVLEESNKTQSDLLNTANIKSTIMERVQDKELQKTIMETGLVKSIDDIDMVMKIVEMSKVLNKGVSHVDGFIPSDEVQATGYEQAEKEGNILAMITHKLSRK